MPVKWWYYIQVHIIVDPPAFKLTGANGVMFKNGKNSKI